MTNEIEAFRSNTNWSASGRWATSSTLQADKRVCPSAAWASLSTRYSDPVPVNYNKFNNSFFSKKSISSISDLVPVNYNKFQNKVLSMKNLSFLLGFSIVRVYGSSQKKFPIDLLLRFSVGKLQTVSLCCSFKETY